MTNKKKSILTYSPYELMIGKLLNEPDEVTIKSLQSVKMPTEELQKIVDCILEGSFSYEKLLKKYGQQVVGTCMRIDNNYLKTRKRKI